MRSRCLLDMPGITVTVANPRLIALTSPTSFDADVIQKALGMFPGILPSSNRAAVPTVPIQLLQVVSVGKQQHAVSNEPGIELQEAA